MLHSFNSINNSMAQTIDHLMYDIIEFFDSTLESGELPEYLSRIYTSTVELQPLQANQSVLSHSKIDDDEPNHLLSILSEMSSVFGILETTTVRTTPKPACPILADADRIRTSSSRKTDRKCYVEQRAHRIAHQHRNGDRIRAVEDQTGRDPPPYHEAIGIPHSSKAWYRERVSEDSPTSAPLPSSPSRWNSLRSRFKGRLFESKHRKRTPSSTLRVVTMESTTGRTAVAVLPKH